MANLLQLGQEDSSFKLFSRIRMFQNGTRSPGLVVSSFVLSLLVILIMVCGAIIQGQDYIGPDNDDVMRLVQVRDFLAGQNWFDMHQYRLGFDGGTLMHWSRLIDAPIAGLAVFFSLFLSAHTAEVLAVSVWPLSLVFPFLWAAGKGGYNLGGRPAMLIAQLLGAIVVFSVHRFHPGSIDHHNAQMTLIAIIVAMMLDPDKKVSSFLIAGISSAVALVIGIETTPLVAVLAMIIALHWGIYGEVYRKAAIAFGISFAVTVFVAFFVFTPVSRYAAVTCDNFSVGFASLSVVGGLLLGTSALFFSGKSFGFRAGSLLATGIVVAGMLFKIAPQCLQDPFASFDPLLMTMWLNNVMEAQSFVSQIYVDPSSMGAFYATGFIAIIICAYRIKKGDNLSAYSFLLIASLCATLLACYQIRGFIFSITIGIFPISAFVADLQKAYRADTKNNKAALAFVSMALIATPATWALGGALLNQAAYATVIAGNGAKVDAQMTCRKAADMKQLASLEPGLVAGGSNVGATILRYTKNRVLSAPYHRNPDGMLKVLKIQLAQPTEAEKLMRDAHVRYYVVCETDSESNVAAEREPAGLTAALSRGDVPSFLEKLPRASELQFDCLCRPSAAGLFVRSIC